MGLVRLFAFTYLELSLDELQIILVYFIGSEFLLLVRARDFNPTKFVTGLWLIQSKGDNVHITHATALGLAMSGVINGLKRSQLITDTYIDYVWKRFTTS